MSGILRRSSARYLARHRWHTVLSVLGVALGVGVVFSIDTVNGSARRAFRLSTSAVTGRATHHVVGGPGGVADSVYTRLRVEAGIRDCAPVVDGYVGVDGIPGRAFRVLGVDPFAEPRFRDHLAAARLSRPPDLAGFLLLPRSTFVPASLAEKLGIVAGDRIVLRHKGARYSLAVVGVMDAEAAGGLGDLLVMDVATAQEVLGTAGALTRVDVIAPEGRAERFLADLRRQLPAGLEVVRSQARSKRIEDMSLAFRQNLFALSLLALVVGMFLIYNTMTFSVVRRRGLIGDLRALGVTRREVFALVIGEALAIGTVGTVTGIVVGSLLSQALVGMVTQTINDLYFVLNVRSAQAQPLAIAKAVALGVGATVVSAALPARAATATPPRFVQNRSSVEARLRARLPALTVSGLALLAVGAVTVALPSRSLFLAFAGLLFLIAGFALLTPGVLVMVLGRFPNAVLERAGLLGRMAVRGVLAQLSRSAVAIAALSIAVGTTVGVTTMVKSFRETVVAWLEVTLDADIYVSPPTLVSSRNDATLDPSLVERLTALDGVSGANYVRGFLTETGHGVCNLVALDMTDGSEARFRLLEGDAGRAWAAFRAGRAALVSEPYASRYGVTVGDSVFVRGAAGTGTGAGSAGRFVVAAIYQDYASDVGTVMISLDGYRRTWRDERVSGVGLFVAHADSVAVVMRRIDALLTTGDEVVVRSNRELRERSIEIFDRTFAITNVLRLLTVLVAFIGVLSALMALQLERSRELGVLRAIGLTPGQLWRLVTAQTGLMGLVSGVIALPFGVMLAAILIFVVNKRSFGWTLDMYLSAGVLLQAIGIAVFAAVLAGLYPGYKMSRTPPARALREE